MNRNPALFADLFYGLREAGLKVGLNEWMTLMEAMESGAVPPNLTDFCYVARSLLVKSETYFDLWDEVFAAALLVELPVPQEREHRVTTRTVTMEEKAILILQALKQEARVEFGRLVRGFRDRSHGVMTFLAGLELTRRRMLLLRQTKPFSELWIYRREDSDDQAQNSLEMQEASETEEGEGAG